MLAQQLLPYNFVDSAPFRKLMSSVAPQWRIPSRHYFARKAIPALHQQMVACVARSMDHAVGGKVHFTTDAWSSRHGQGKYITYTAHWVILHRAGDGGRSCPVSQQLVVPPRGVKGRPAPLPSATCSVAGQVVDEPPIKQFRSYTGMQHHRCQAMLKLVSMEEKRQTGSEILSAFEDQIRQWLAPRKLLTGIVVSDNGSNMLSAMRLGGYTHLPCLAHVFNLIVSKFLGTYEGLKDAVSTARKVSAHIRRSATASASLKLLQRRHNLPQHRLISDCPTRWNSTLYMLQRLWEQRMAVRIYLSETASSNLSLDYITGDQWEQIGQVCQVLQPFEQATKLVSMENCSISQVLPLIFMLDKMLFNLLGRGDQSAQANSGVSDHADAQEEDVGEAEVEEEEEEEAIVRGWEEIDELLEQDGDSCDNRPEEEISGRHLFPMAAHMIQCFKSDPRIKKLKVRLDMWVATILDPRCKGKLRQFLPPSQADNMMRKIHEALARWVEDAFPAPSPRATVFTPLQSTQQSCGGPSSTKKPQNLLSMFYDFYQPESSNAPCSSTSSNSSHRQRLDRMVSDYLGSASAPDNIESNDPMEYWTKKIDTWPELAQYALEVLACPASSVLSERVFSAAGGVVTDYRTRLSAENVDRLTFIKMNESWINDDFNAPLIDP
ncbi:zinc finger BED domain-containing protein 6-like [Hyperolius riggenbachi]|uniref:zinc finger BED domain-containing protein 6-like n=1 Tax=Hyperolius riggenbachi TaxID=752182 RepID=UPI0035A3CA16